MIKFVHGLGADKMTQQDFNQEQNPYQYEKPVSANRFRKYGSIAAFGVLALGTAFGGNAIAATVMATDATATTSGTGFAADSAGALPVTNGLGADSPASMVTVLDANGVPMDSAIQIVSGSPSLSQTLGVSAPGSSQSPIITLPVLPVTDYGNVSSATPSGGSASSNAAGGTSWGEDDDDDDDEDDDDRDDDDRDED